MVSLKIDICLFTPLSDVEIKVLEKESDCSPIQGNINEPELREDFEEFCRCMSVK